MLIKLTYSADKSLQSIFRAVDQIINTPSITSISALTAAGTAGSWDATVLANLDVANSEIVRTGTKLTTNTKSHYARTSTSTSYSDAHAWTVRFSVYDNTDTKFYVQHYCTQNTSTEYAVVGSSITAGSMDSGSTPPTASLLTTTAYTPVTLGGTSVTSTVSAATTSSGFTNIRTFWMYITDAGMVWCTTLANTYPVGFGSTYSNSATYNGPWIYSQYTRFDYHNTVGNGIIPVLFTNPFRASGAGFGQTVNDWDSIDNTQATLQTTQAFRVLNLVNAHPQVGSSWPVVVAPTVAWGVGSRYNDWVALTASNSGTVSSTNSPSYGPALFKTVSTRFPSADLKTQAFAMLPLTWRNTYYYNAGGDASAQSGIYIFNGDYYPGDEFVYNNKTYKIFPTWTGYSNRIGIAVPKE